MEKYYVAIDTETFLIADDCKLPELVCVSVYSEAIGPALYTGDEFEKIFKQFLRDDSITLIAHNASFDFSVLSVAYSDEILELIHKKYDNNLIVCTQLNEKLIRLGTDGVTEAREGFSLAFCAEKYLGLDISEDKKNPDAWRLKYHTLAGVPIREYPKEAADYAKEDARICYEVYMQQMERNGSSSNLSLQCHSDWACRIISASGLCIDGDFLEERLAEVQEVVTTQREVLKEEEFLVRKFKTKNPDEFKKDTKAIKAVVESYFEEKELPLPVTDTGKTQCSREVLETIGEGYHTGIDALLAMGTNEKALTTYLLPWQGNDKIFPEYDILKDSGRMSCKKPNIQNVPRAGRIRGCIVPSPGMVFCAIDFSQLELCSLSQVIKENLPHVEPEMLNAINAGLDLHCLTGSTIAGIPYDEFIDNLSDYKEYRQMAKAANFGFPGGLGNKTFKDFAKASYGLILDDKTVAKIKKAYFKTFPDVRAYLDNIESYLTDTDEGTFYRCEQLFTDRVRMVKKEKYCAAANTFFQGLAADGIKHALIKAFEYCWFEDKECYPIMIIHDEIIFELPEDADMSPRASVLSEIMVNAMQTWLPDVTNIQAAPALMKRWEKEAEPVFDKEGDLIIWER